MGNLTPKLNSRPDCGRCPRSVVCLHTVDTEFSVTNFFCLHSSEHAQWGLPVMSDILVKIFVDISCNICGLLLL